MLVVQLAKTSNLLFGGTSNFLVAREFLELATYDEKLALMRCLFAVSATDASISTAKKSEIHRIARELRIEQPDLIALRVAHQRHICRDCRAGVTAGHRRRQTRLVAPRPTSGPFPGPRRP